MAFKISATGDLRPAINVGLRAERLSKVSPSSFSRTEVAEPAASEQRFVLSSVSSRLLAVQNKVSEDQASSEALEELQNRFSDTKQAGTEQEFQDSLQSLNETVENKSFEGRQLLTGRDYPNTSTEESVQAVTVSNPPKAGSFSISLIDGPDIKDAITYRIEVEDTEHNTKRSVQTSVHPATGLISGVELYFEKIPPVAQVNVKIRETQDFPVPDFGQEIEKLQQASLEERPQRIADFERKLATTRKGVEKDLQRRTEEFQKLSSARENLNSASSDLSSAALAKEAMGKTSDALLKNSTSAMNLFRIDPGQLQKLLS